MCLENLNETHTLYAIYLSVESTTRIEVGKLGRFTFPAGTYIYIGSAKRNIKARISRHLKKEKKQRWHFDYLRPYGEVVKVETFDDTISECKLYEMKMIEVNGRVMAKKFGSSDCKCLSHLVYID
ncbi:MAG: GIY-YIG nuclease family protein [Bacillaceae bacterium]|nr:GIY-YIG nuclease family protein [Bacillaceae bacterium]